MVEDVNNFGDVYDGIDMALDDGMESLHELLLSNLESNWVQGSDAMGRAWTPLDPKTIEAKGHSSILMDSGSLLDDVLTNSYYDADSRTSVIRTTSAYGAVHEFGLPERGIPRRPFLGPTAEKASELVGEIEEELDKHFARVEVR